MVHFVTKFRIYEFFCGKSSLLFSVFHSTLICAHSTETPTLSVFTSMSKQGIFSHAFHSLKKHHRINLGHRQLKYQSPQRKKPLDVVIGNLHNSTKRFIQIHRKRICIFHCKPVIFHAKTGHIDQKAFPHTHTRWHDTVLMFSRGLL